MATVPGSRRPHAMLLGLVVALLPSVGAGVEPAIPPASWVVSLQGDRLGVHADRAPLRLVLAELANQGGFQVDVSAAAVGAIVSVTFLDLRLEEGLAQLLAGWAYAVLYAPGAAEAAGAPVRRIAHLMVLSPAREAASPSSGTGSDPLAAAPAPLSGLTSPDPQERIQALERWAAGHDGAGVDPLTHALVDEDEQVRARAQELFEETLTRGQSPH